MTGPRDGRLARGPAVVTAVLSLACVVGLAAVLVPWDWVPGGRLVPASVGSLFTSAQVERAERYSWLQRGFGWSSYFLSVVVFLLIAFTRPGSRFVARVRGRHRWWVAVPLVAAAVLIVERLVTLPFTAGSQAVRREYGISRQGYGGWLVDVAKSWAVSWVVTTLLLLVIVGLARRSPRWWFAWAGVLAFLLSVAGSFLYPVLVEPLFNKFTPMQPGPFKESVFRLADREGVTIDDVLVADASRRTTTLNAYVSGFGGTRRVVVYDNLLDDLTPGQARVVIAHELGHAKNNDVLLGTALGAIGSIGGVALLALILETSGARRRARIAGAGDPSAVAVMIALASVAMFVVSPAQNTVSRAIEARADRASLAATGADRVFVQMQRQLALTSLADPTPPRVSQLWFGSHPTVLQRAGLPASLRAASR